MNKKTGLGRGLGALIDDSNDNIKSFVEAQKPGEKIVQLPLEKIQPNPYQPRKDFSEEELQGLAVSIKKQGLLQPIIVRSVEDHYELIAGERRLRAIKLNGETEIAAVVRAYTDVESMNLALLENLQRQDLNPMEVANAYARLMQEGGMTQEELSDKLGVPRSTVANTLRLLNLPVDVQNLVAQGNLSASVARSISALPSFAVMSEFAQKAVSENWSAARTEKEVRNEKNKPLEQLKEKKPGVEGKLDRNEHLKSIHKELPHFVETLENITGERVEVVTLQGKNKVLGFKFRTTEDLERLYQVLGEAFTQEKATVEDSVVKDFSV